MARHVETLLIDDLDGSKATETIHFAYQGTEYSIDLNETNASKFRKRVAPYANAARRVPKVIASRAPIQRGPARVDKEQHQAMREWLRTRGVDVSDRGRIPERYVGWYQTGEVPAGVAPETARAVDEPAPAAPAVEASTPDEPAPDAAVTDDAPKVTKPRKATAARKTAARKTAKAATK